MKYPFLLIAIIVGFTACTSSSVEDNNDEQSETHENVESRSNATLIKGSWQVDGMELDMSDTLNMSEEQKAIARNDQKALFKELEEYKSKMKIVFNEGGYTFFQPTDTVTGQWSLLADTVLEFRITGFEGYPQYANVRHVGDSLLHMYDSNIRGVLQFKRIK